MSVRKRDITMPTKTSTKKSVTVQTWPGDKLVRYAASPGFHDEFRALMEEETRIVQQRGLKDWSYAYFTVRESGEFDVWLLGTTESLEARWKLLATKAGRALGAPRVLPWTYWLHRLFMYLRANESDFVRMYSDTNGFIERLFEASVIFCARLERSSLEKNYAGRGGRSLGTEGRTSASIAETERRGYRTEVREWMAREGVATLEFAAKRLHISVSALKSVMSKRGKCRYGEATLAQILGTIGYKGE
jgi:hypothetical protein